MFRHLDLPGADPRTQLECNLTADVVVKAMRKAGCWFLFLPPYSPDLNPIEMAFSKLKAHLRRLGARTFTDMFHALSEICDLYSQDECWNYFKAAGYVSS